MKRRDWKRRSSILRRRRRRSSDSAELTHPFCLRLLLVRLETRAEDARAEHAAARQQAEDDHLVGVGHKEVKDSRLAWQDDFAHDLIFGMILKFRECRPRSGKRASPAARASNSSTVSSDGIAIS